MSDKKPKKTITEGELQTLMSLLKGLEHVKDITLFTPDMTDEQFEAAAEKIKANERTDN